MSDLLKKNDIVNLTIDDIASDGNGVGRYNGMAVFVARTAPGDHVRARVVNLQRSYAYGIVDELVEPSPVRVESDCACFAQCGGCDFRHISYEAELGLKTKFVADALRRIGGLDVSVARCAPSPHIDEYRNKAAFPVAQDGDRLVAGLFAPRSHRVLPETLSVCHLQPSLLNDIAAACCALLECVSVRAYDESAGSGLLRHILLRQSSLDGGVMLCLVVNGDTLPDESGFCSSITAQFPTIKAIVLNINKKRGNAILGTENKVVFGSGYLEDELAGVPVRLAANSFFQVNHGAASLLYDAIADYADPQPNETLLDLYCGVGTIGLSMAARLGQVIGVESVPNAVADARANAVAMGALNASFICADAAAAAHELTLLETKIDCIVADPPRKGCDAQTQRAMLALSPRRIVMVSCNAATLARDLKTLVENGAYSLKGIKPFDLFPRTHHVEAVCLLEKTNEVNE